MDYGEEPVCLVSIVLCMEKSFRLLHYSFRFVTVPPVQCGASGTVNCGCSVSIRWRYVTTG